MLETNIKEKYGKEYICSGNNKIQNIKKVHNILNILKDNDIPHNLYFYYDDVYGALLKIYGESSNITTEKRRIIKKLNFYSLPSDYEFTWKWEIINKNDIETAIDAIKYNL